MDMTMMKQAAARLPGEFTIRTRLLGETILFYVDEDGPNAARFDLRTGQAEVWEPAGAAGVAMLRAMMEGVS